MRQRELVGGRTVGEAKIILQLQFPQGEPRRVCRRRTGEYFARVTFQGRPGRRKLVRATAVPVSAKPPSAAIPAAWWRRIFPEPPRLGPAAEPFQHRRLRHATLSARRAASPRPRERQQIGGGGQRRSQIAHAGLHAAKEIGALPVQRG